VDKVLQARKIICLDEAGSTTTWVGIEDGVIAGTGNGDPPEAREIIRSEGVVIPGMIDAHVHLTTTGIYRRGLDLRECRSVPALLEQVAKFLETADSNWIIGGNFDPGRNDDGRLPTRRELDEVSGDKVVVISRADGHSCAMNSPAFERLQIDSSLAGFEKDEDGQPLGVLANESNYEARSKFFSELPDKEIRAAQLEGCLEALEHGVTSVHEMSGGDDRDISVLVTRMGSFPIHVRPYFSTTDVKRVAARKLDFIGGDLFLDGSIGSRTAAMSRPYSDSEGSGFLYHRDDEIAEYFIEASRAGMQAGVHAIGDAAIEQAISCIEIAADEVGLDEVRRLRHRIEHYECVSREQIRRSVRLGVVASVQPMFDGYWGGNNGMYSMRLGERAESMNPFSKMVAAGMIVAGGSDSTVTPLNPLLGISAAVNHHVPDFAVSVDQALRMFTIWGATAGRHERVSGSIEPGKRPDFCVLADDPYELDPGQLADIEVLETWVSGTRAWTREGAGDSLHSPAEGA
jgi:predicted amidohydrolase YtcJ